MKKLVIAEKPSVAQDIAKVIGDFQKKNNGIFENDQYVISSAVGHVVELFMPEDFDASWKRWSIDILPIIPEEFHTKPIAKTKDKFSELKKLLNRKDIGSVINACDAGREGELIFTYIYELAGCQKPVERLWLSSMTQEAIREGFQNLRPGSEMKNLQDAARCRSEADWLVGINGTRAISAKMFSFYQGVATIGRVQTPTLSMLLKREHEIRDFKPTPYYRIIAEFSVANGQYKGIYQRPDFKKSSNECDRIDRLFDEQQAEQIINEVKQSGTAIVTEKKKKSTQNAPRLYDLTTLQREANTRYSMPAGMTLKIAQSLYEKHKCLTYPRTDSNALPEDYPDTCQQVLHSLNGEFAPFAEEILKNQWINGSNKRIFNNKQISDHFAIIPTTKFPKSLTESESKIYSMVVNRFLAVFYPAAEYEITTRTSVVGSHQFLTEGKIITFPGWLAVYGKSFSEESKTIPALDKGKDGDPAKAQVSNVEKKEEMTKPSPRYTEATLLSMMETAGEMLDDEELASAMKERGLGTPATRAQIIDHLLDLNYMERNKRELIPTSKAEQLFEYLDAVDVKTISSPALTGDWEFKLRQMEHGQLDRATFMDGIKTLTKEMVSRIKNFDETTAKPQESSLISPTDGQPMNEFLKNYQSKDGKLTLNKIILGRRMLLTEFETLLRDREVGPLEGFRSKIGKVYAAKLVLDENNEVKFVFPNPREFFPEKELTIDSLKQFPVVGKCCRCGSDVHATDSAYMCENYINEENKCPLRLGRRILEQRIDEEQMAKLLQTGKSDLLENFCSKKTGKVFAAYLLLSKEGKISFEFPPKVRKSSAPANKDVASDF